MRLPNHYKKRYIILVVILAIFLMIQFTTTKVQNSPQLGQIEVPAQVKRIFKRSCYNCHSNQSELKWFDRIAPVSHLVTHDVTEAKSRFNFSEWDKIPKVQQEVLLWEMVNAIEQKKMPLNRYLTLHPEARVSASELAMLKRYVNTLPGRKRVDTNKVIKEVDQARAVNNSMKGIPISLTGIPYSDNYKSWKVISITDKFDGGSMRIVYGNDIMVKALQNNQLPFPNGAAMAKVVWAKKTEDAEGNVLPGNFQNVQFMIKDGKKFKSTENWGFARFDGLKLKAFGKNVSFAKTCINCHRLLVKDNDFVFNIPNNNDKFKQLNKDVK